VIVCGSSSAMVHHANPELLNCGGNAMPGLVLRSDLGCCHQRTSNAATMNSDAAAAASESRRMIARRRAAFIIFVSC
jgi:hypothetical protein